MSQEKKVSRRGYLKYVAAVAVVGVVGVGAGYGLQYLAPKPEKGPIVVANAFRNLINEYWVHWNDGGADAAGAIGCGYLPLEGANDEKKMVSDVETAIAKGVKTMAVMPVTAGLIASIADMCEKNRVWLTSMWDKPEELDPAKYTYWNVHVTQDTRWHGYIMAKILFDAMGGKGNIVSVGGLPGTGSAELRHEGLDQALKEYPNIKQLAYESGGYNRFKAAPVMEDFLSAYGDKIEGIWCANDDMAMGVLETLRAAGKVGKIPVVGIDAIQDAVAAIQKGELLATVDLCPYLMGGLGVVFAFDAYNGYTFPKDQKIYILKGPLVDKSNAEKFFAEHWVEGSRLATPWRSYSKTLGGEWPKS